MIALAFALGIIIDYFFSPPLFVWVSLGFIFLGVRHLWSRSRVGALFWASLAVGGGWHAHFERLWPTDDVSRFVAKEQVFCRLRGVIEGEVVRIEPNPLERSLSQQEDVRTRFTLRVSSIEGRRGSVSGRVVVHLAGRSAGWTSGDEISMLGWLASPREPSNQGESNYARYLRDDRIAALFFVDGAEGVSTHGSGFPGPLQAVRETLRQWGGQLLREGLSPRSAALAEAFLLGIRTSLSPSDVLPFVESGTIHVLVVSGLHVALIAHIVWMGAAILVRSIARRAILSMVVVVLYTLVTGANPPAVRAAVASILVLGQFVGNRSAEPINTLAASALVVMLGDPGDLFRTGPQLSFLCAMAILVLLGGINTVPNEISPMSTAWQRGGRVALEYGKQLFISCVVLWLVTAPLLASTFHLFSPISVIASMILVPLSEGALGIGVAYLGLGMVPVLGDGLAWLLDVSMRILDWTSTWAASIEWGSIYLAGPSPLWVGVWYGALLFPWAIPTIRPLGRTHLALLLTWLTVGGVLLSASPLRLVTRYHQLAVGHGNAGVLRTADRQTLLFDAGSTMGPEVADRIVAPWLWQEGVGYLDAVFISHSDIDHFNGLLRLARRFSIGAVYLPQSFVRSQEPGAVMLLEELWKRSIPIRFLWAQDKLRVGKSTIRVWHPPIGFRGRNDNAESLVLSIDEAGKRILLTGDIEGEGLDRLLSLPSESADVLIAPHHGAAGSNTDELADWCRPRVVISSQGIERRRVDTLSVYQEKVNARTLMTHESGEVQIDLGPGELEVRTFHDVSGFLSINR
jgi:competence protein ComEC